MSAASVWPTLHEVLKTVAGAFAIFIIFRSLVYQPFIIPSPSMETTLLVGDYILVNKFAYGYSRHSFPFSFPPFEGRILAGAPQRGDIVVFKLPRDGSSDYVKRIIGLPGERVRIMRGVVQINGVAAQLTPQEPLNGGPMPVMETLPGGVSHLILLGSPDHPSENTDEFLVPEGHYFVMGDHREDSIDSRFAEAVGFIPAENLVGRVDSIFFSADGSAGFLEIWAWPGAIRWNRLMTAVR